MRVAYLIQSHGRAELLPRLVAALRTGSDGTILVVHDACQAALDPSRLAGTDALVLQRSTPVRRGDYSMLEPYLEGAAWPLDTKHRFDWLVYLSAQDYPVRSVAALERDLESSPADGYLAHWDVSGADCPWPARRVRRRYFYAYARLPERLAPWLRVLRPLEAVTPLHLFLTYGPLIGWPVRRTPFGEAFRCWGGWMWHTLRRECVENLLGALASRPELVAYYRRTVVADESLVQTVLVNSGRFRLVKDNRRLADTDERPGGHARILTAADLAEATCGRYDFARKMEPVASGPLLDALDARLH